MRQVLVEVGVPQDRTPLVQRRAAHTHTNALTLGILYALQDEADQMLALVNTVGDKVCYREFFRFMFQEEAPAVCAC